jgi:amino acid transporter
MVLTIALLFFGDLSIVANATVVGVVITFFLVNLSVIRLRQNDPDTTRPFKIKPAVKQTPVPAVLGALICLGLLFTFDWFTIIIQTVIIVIGLILFYAVRNRFQQQAENP